MLYFSFPCWVLFIQTILLAFFMFHQFLFSLSESDLKISDFCRWVILKSEDFVDLCKIVQLNVIQIATLSI